MSFLTSVAPLIGLATSLFSQPNPAPQNVQSPAQSGAIPPYVASYLQQAYPWLAAQLGHAPSYGGQLQVPMNPLTQQAYSDIGSLGQITPAAGGATMANILGLNLDPTQNPVVANMISAIQGSTGQQLNDQLKQLHAQYGMMSPVGGSYGSGFELGQSDLISRLLTGEQGTVANLLQQIYGQNLANQQSSIQAGLNIPQMEQNIGGAQQNLQQQNIQNQYQNYLNSLAYLWQAVAPLTGLSQAVSSPGTYNPSSSAPFASAGQGLMRYLQTNPSFNPVGGGASVGATAGADATIPPPPVPSPDQFVPTTSGPGMGP